MEGDGWLASNPFVPRAKERSQSPRFAVCEVEFSHIAWETGDSMPRIVSRYRLLYKR